MIKGYEFFTFAKNLNKIISKSGSKNISGKYSHKPLDYVKQSATHALKTPSKTVSSKQKQLVISLVIKWLIKLQNLKKKCLKKAIYKKRQKTIDDLKLI